jgi:methylglutaconyl-CoA hydratase
MIGIYCGVWGWTKANSVPGDATAVYFPAMSQEHDVRHEGQVIVEQRDAIATVRFSHPKSNSLPGALLRRIADEIGKIAQHSGLKVIVLRSEGTGAFCAGASFDEMKAVNDAASGREFFSGFAQVILAMIRAPQFVVTRVHGKVTGGGVGLVAASDYSIAVSGASFKLSELAVGLGPFVIGPVVERKVGRGPFQALSIDADWRDAAYGERHGLYSRVVDDTKALDAELEKLLTFLAGANPEAIRQMKQAFWADTDDWAPLLERRAAISGALALSAHTRSAIETFAKR